MYEKLYLVDFIIVFVLVLSWALVANRLSRLPFRNTNQELKQSMKRFTIVYIVALVVVIAELIVLGLLGTYGWEFMKEKLFLSMPLLIPSVFATLFTLSNLRKITRHIGNDSQFVVDEEHRKLLTSSKFILPIQATLVSAIIDCYAFYFVYPFELNIMNASMLWIAFALILVALWFRQKRRSIKLVQTHYVMSPSTRLLRTVISLVCLSIIIGGWYSLSAKVSVLPDHINMGSMHHQEMDMKTMHHSMSDKEVSVATLTGPRTKKADHRFELVAQKKQVKLSSGKTMEAWTFNGVTPGPQLRVKQGDIVEVVLKNKDITDGVTIHWHGYNVPNAEDGVAGVTQDSVQPGGTHVYRFEAKQLGTFWYHSHQQSAKQVIKGLFGSLIVEPKESTQSHIKDITVLSHAWQLTEDKSFTPSYGLSDTLDRQIIKPGTPVRLRIINAQNYPQTFQLSDVPFKVIAIDGNDIHSPTSIKNRKLFIAGGGRYDVLFTMPKKPVRLSSQSDAGVTPGIVFSEKQTHSIPDTNENNPVFDPSQYGKKQQTPFNLNSKFDRDFKLILDSRAGFYNGKLRLLYTINGQVFPNTPMLTVKEGDFVKTTFVNRGLDHHPMHLHGHLMLVLSQNGKPTTGSPWWTDSLDVAPGEVYEVAFKADNPGVWMDHCHNLWHAEMGMTMHLNYEGVTTPFEAGKKTVNQPE
ncbi:Multicopper oxidase with three cupredoxin domains (includes cell division protein FtsP and spore coat protein CotA) [Seinonella peptonophila]|uniref:Multicopper oxidase with three cupredoxin domains (Includes cell division protein FtsP and spore coat protein CotA) n=1 Tax=Seinonella peptonophila TaxID=112248 RepID=A0A1M5BFX1_9BACL|nr:multicopper oxidase family protein [Seinonella peptonophila]SHF41338.1 Multicopper oxidase with three cupredoxin domains (includes cell division protein FtsP and spore coat protein CotA) [Seinonella peptonophila]